MMTPYVRMRMANKGKGSFRAEGSVIWLYDTIAADADEAEWWGGVSPQDFINALKATTGPVLLRINSPGGSVFGAQAMIAAMREHDQPITARVDSLAASAASVIACEAARMEMVPGSMLMIHKAWGFAIGNDDEMVRVGALLGKIDQNIADSYAGRAGGDKDDWLAAMKAETWFDADEAVAAKLADGLVEGSTQRPANKWDLSAFLAAPWAAPDTAGDDAEGDAYDKKAKKQADEMMARARKAAARLIANQF